MKVIKNSYDVAVIGGGIIGLATALRILQIRPKTRLILIEKETKLAQHQTGHNSGVIHSGLYYTPGSLKAINCRNGYEQLIEFCREEDIPHDICGKIVVATSKEELPGLDELYRRGLSNGLEGIRYLETDEITEREPFCKGVRGLYVPQTGIVDYSVLTQKYAEKLMLLGAEIIYGENIVDIKHSSNKVEVISDSQTWTSVTAIVCAGLQSDRMALKTEPDLPLRILPFRGEYYKLKLSAQSLVKNLIYPVPDPDFPFLGVHFTRMIDGSVECGPNAVFAFGREAYKKTDFNLADTWESLTWPGFRKVAVKYWRNGLGEYHRSISKSAFVKTLQRLIPEIKSEHLENGGSGIRAQACDRQGNLLDDFDFRVNGNVIHVCNAPSPAATASLSIGDVIADKALAMLS